MSRTQAPPPAARQQPARLERALLVVGVIALGYNLRGSITSLPPVFPELRASLHLSAATISVLAATPVICFGVFSGFAASLSRRLGEERVLLAASLTLVVGLAARGAAASVLLFPGTIVCSAAIAIMNVLLSSLIKRRWPERAGLLIGVYLTALSAGAIVGSLVSIPLWNATGGSVAVTLGWLAIPAAVAAVVWLPQLSSGGRPPVPPGARPMAKGATVSDARSGAAKAGRVPVHRYRIAWYVTAFMGLQSLVYYAALSYLPTMLRARGDSAADAGDLLAVMGVGNLAVSLIVPVAAQRMRSQVPLILPTVLALAGGLAGLLYAPLGGAAGWALLLGAGQNAALALAIFLTAARSPDAATVASLSALAQAVGYLLSAAGPLEVGLLHSVTGSWTLPVAVLFALNGVQLVVGFLAARPGMLPPAEKERHDPGPGRLRP